VGLDDLGGLLGVGAVLADEGGEGGLGGAVVVGLAQDLGGAEGGVDRLLGVLGLAGVADEQLAGLGYCWRLSSRSAAFLRAMRRCSESL
jgi:hypothetical protein